MYQILLGNNILYDIRDKDLLVESPKLDLEINKVGSLSFNIYPIHPLFNQIQNKVSRFTVKKDNKIIFKGRMIEEEAGIYNSKSITVEGDLAYLNDSIVRPYTFSGTPEEHFSNLINNHNSQVSEFQKFKIGIITVTDPNNYIARSSINYANTWKVLNEDLIDKLGGYIRLRYEADGTYIDWLEDFDDTSTQTIELGKNLIDVLVKNNAAEVYSAVLPLGAKIESEGESEERLTIKSVNNGLDYLVNQTALNKYGFIVAPVEETTWDDVTVAANLKTKGQQYLDNTAVMLKSSLEVKAIDLNLTDKQIESFFIYEYVRFASKILNINKTYLLNKISIPLDDPTNMQITLGEETNTLTGIQLGNKNNINNVLNKVEIIEKDYQINNEKLQDLESAVKYFSVDLSQYNLVIPTNSDNKPLTSKNYDVFFYGYFKGKQVTPTVSITGTNTGITVSKTDTYIRFAVISNTAITNTLNQYTIKFTYTVDSISYEVTKIVDIALALKGIDGTSGQDGHDGQDGADGKSAYEIWLEAGNTGTEQDYLNSLKGQDGKDGIQGPKGEDGTSYYFYVRYSANANGNPMTTAPQSNTKYMGVATTTSPTAPTSYTAYSWSLIKGADGTNGTQGPAGADGKSSYLHIKYSDDGTTFTANSGEDVGRYRGELVDNNPVDSTNFNDYTWYDMALIVEDELNGIREEIVTNLTSITQDQEQILMEALQDYISTNDFETFKETISTQFIQTAEDFTFNFNNLTSQITKVDGDTQQQFQEIHKYIRFEDGKIILGEAGNELTLVQQNDRISFMQGNNEVAYFSNNKLTVTDGDFLNSLQIGNFAFKPRANGNLSLVYVGGDTVG